MPRLIDADALLVEVEKYCDGCDSNEGSRCKNCEYDNWLYSIEIATTIEAAPVVHGRWEDFCGGKMCCCSACKAEFDNTCNEIHGEWKFCPNCGAKMDLKSEEAN